jgi:hypothetical protein
MTHAAHSAAAQPCDSPRAAAAACGAVIRQRLRSARLPSVARADPCSLSRHRQPTHGHGPTHVPHDLQRAASHDSLPMVSLPMVSHGMVSRPMSRYPCHGCASWRQLSLSMAWVPYLSLSCIPCSAMSPLPSHEPPTLGAWIAMSPLPGAADEPPLCSGSRSSRRAPSLFRQQEQQTSPLSVPAAGAADEPPLCSGSRSSRRAPSLFRQQEPGPLSLPLSSSPFPIAFRLLGGPRCRAAGRMTSRPWHGLPCSPSLFPITCRAAGRIFCRQPNAPGPAQTGPVPRRAQRAREELGRRGRRGGMGSYRAGETRRTLCVGDGGDRTQAARS